MNEYGKFALLTEFPSHMARNIKEETNKLTEVQINYGVLQSKITKFHTILNLSR
jgi:hypothetical protein